MAIYCPGNDNVLPSQKNLRHPTLTTEASYENQGESLFKINKQGRS